MRTIFVTVLIQAALVVAQPAAQAPKTARPKQQPPAPGPARAFSFPKFESRKLANGLTVFVVEDHRQPIISYWLAVDGGSVRVNQEKAGLADMTATLLRNGGTKTRTSQDIAKLVDANGGSLSGDASQDAAFVHGTWMKSHADLGLDLLADIVLNPVFDAQELERMRQQALSGLQIAFSSPESLIEMAAARVVFGQNPYAYPEGGTPDTVRGLKREDLVAFHKAHYVPAGAYLAVAGDITPADAFARIEKYLGKWAGNPASGAKMPSPPALDRRVVVIDKPDAPQTRIFVGEAGIARNDPDFIPLLLANEIFGGAFTSRLNLRLRATEGLTYNASSALNTMRSAGEWGIETFTRTEKTGEAVRQILDVQRGFSENPPTASELADAKARLIGLFQLSTETPDAVAQRRLLGAVEGLPANYYSDYTQRISATNLDQVIAASKKHFHPDKNSIVVVGNASQFAKELAPLGTVRTIKASDFDPVAPDLTRPKESAPAATAESRGRARELVEAAAKAIGGVDALRAVKDQSSKSNVVLKTPQGEMKAEAAEDILYPDKFKASLKLPFGEILQVFDGRTFWIKQGPMVREMPAQARDEALRTILSSGGLGILISALDGKAEIQTVENDVVLWKQGEMTVRLFFDPQTHRISKMIYRSAGMAGPAEVEHSMSDYRPAGAIQLPFKETMTQAGQPGGERNYTERKVNTGLTPDLFNKPQ